MYTHAPRPHANEEGGGTTSIIIINVVVIVIFIKQMNALLGRCHVECSVG